MNTRRLVPIAALAAVLPAGCAKVKVEPIEVKPIHITMDVNVRVDRRLDDFFAFQEQMYPATQPTAVQPGGIR